MSEVLDKKKEEMDMEKIEPFSDECKFGKNGIWLFIGPQGSGKTHKLIQTILYTEFMGDKPYFNNIIFSSTSDTLDKTLDAFRRKIKTKIEFVKQDKLFARLQSHIKRKTKFYSIMKYIKSKGESVDPTMRHIAEKHKLFNRVKTGRYLKKKMDDYGHPNYPANLLLILDDYLGSNLLENKMSPMVQFLTKCRHFNITCIIAQQSTKGIGRTVRRLSSDACVWRGFGETDFVDLTKEFNLSMDRKALYQIYKQFKDRHDNMEFHNHIDVVEIDVHNQLQQNQNQNQIQSAIENEQEKE